MVLLLMCLQNPTRGTLVRCIVFASVLTGSCTRAARRTALSDCGRQRWEKPTACGSVSFLVSLNSELMTRVHAFHLDSVTLLHCYCNDSNAERMNEKVFIKIRAIQSSLWQHCFSCVVLCTVYAQETKVVRRCCC